MSYLDRISSAEIFPKVQYFSITVLLSLGPAQPWRKWSASLLLHHSAVTVEAAWLQNSSECFYTRGTFTFTQLWSLKRFLLVLVNQICEIESWGLVKQLRSLLGRLWERLAIDGFESITSPMQEGTIFVYLWVIDFWQRWLLVIAANLTFSSFSPLCFRVVVITGIWSKYLTQTNPRIVVLSSKSIPKEKWIALVWIVTNVYLSTANSVLERLPGNFHLMACHTWGFSFQAQKLETLHNKHRAPQKVLLSSCHLHRHKSWEHFLQHTKHHHTGKLAAQFFFFICVVIIWEITYKLKHQNHI